MAAVVIHQDENGDITVYADDDVHAFWIDKRVPQDRVYKMSPDKIPEGMIGDDFGHKDDGSAAHVRALRAKAVLEGRNHLEIVKPE